MLTKKLSLLLAFLILPVFAEEATTLEQLKTEYRLPKERRGSTTLDIDSVVHINKGCPLNSGCEEKTGIMRKKWIDIVKSTRTSGQTKDFKIYVQNNGLPINTWLVGEISNSEPVIVWDSPCKHHRPKKEIENEASYPQDPSERYLDKEIYIGEFFIKNFNDLKPLVDKGSVIVYKAYYQSPIDGKVKMIPIPKEEKPTFLNGDQIIIPREEEGLYYHLAFLENGNFQVIDKPANNNFPEATECPKNLVDSFVANEKMIEIYDEFICRSVWDLKTMKRVPILYARSCF